MSLVAAACSAALLHPTEAQQSTSSASAGGLEEIVVSARRREENLQDVPISIVALSSESLELRGVQQLSDVGLQVPNVVLMGGGATGETSGNFHMRGIPGIATYVDGVWQSSDAGLMTMNVVEVERIEVLRGPQGTLFGKNSTGGAIEYVTKLPANEFAAKIELTGGSTTGRTSSHPPTCRSRRTSSSSSRALSSNATDSSRARPRVANSAISMTLCSAATSLWTPSDDVTFRFVAESTEIERNGSARTLEEIRLHQSPAACLQLGRLSIHESHARVGVSEAAPSASGKRCRTSRTTATCPICCA